MKRISTILRQIGQNYVMPIFMGDVSDGAVEKSTAPSALQSSPVTVADIGTQILVTREIQKIFPSEPVFGEEYIPALDAEAQRIIDALDVTKRLDITRTEDAAFLDLVLSIIRTAGALPKEMMDAYRPITGCSWLIDPIDGTIPFKAKKPYFAIQIARIENGRIIGGWIYDPCRDHIFMRYIDQSAVTRFYRADGTIDDHPLICPAPLPYREMRIVYAHAHASSPHDDVSKPITFHGDTVIPHDELKARIAFMDFKEILNTDCYAYSHGQLFLNQVQAVSCPGAYPWDHFAQAFIAQGAGYRVGFWDGQDYLGVLGEISFILNEEGTLIVPRTGGILYAPPTQWNDLNHNLHLIHHPTPTSQRRLFRCTKEMNRIEE